MLLVGSVLSSLALASSPSLMAASTAANAINTAQRDQFGDDDIFAGDTPLTNNELMAARGGIRLNGAEFEIGAQVSRHALQSSLNTTVYRQPVLPQQPVAATQHVAPATRARSVGPVNTGVGAVNNGVAGVGPVSNGVGPVNTVAVPAVANAAPTNGVLGPANITAGPVIINVGPVNTTVAGPVNNGVGPVNTGVGSINVAAGPVNIAVGPFNNGAGPVTNNVIPTINVDIDVTPTVGVNIDVDPQTGSTLALTTPVNGVEVFVAPQGAVTPTIGDVNVLEVLGGGGTQNPSGALPQLAGAALPLPSNNIQVIISATASIRIIDNLADGSNGGGNLVTASIPITEGIRSAVFNITRDNVTFEQTIDVGIVLPDNFVRTTIQPARQMTTFARGMSGRSMLGALGN